MHPTLEELLDKFEKKQETQKTNEEINYENKSILKKAFDFFKKFIPRRQRRKLRKLISL